MNQVVFGFACGSIRPFRANASSLMTPRRIAVDDLARDPGRSRRPVRAPMADAEPPDLDRHVALPSRTRPRPLAPATAPAAARPLGRRPARAVRLLVPFGRMVDSGWANFERVK